MSQMAGGFDFKAIMEMMKNKGAKSKSSNPVVGTEPQGNKWMNALANAVGGKGLEDKQITKNDALASAFSKMKEVKVKPLDQVDASLVKNTEEDEDELNKKMGVKPLKLNSYLA